jgi:pilus assembly protein Flp/PilA
MRHFLFSREGATAVEYAMIAALVSVVIITGAASLGAAMNAKFQMVGDRVSAVAPN